MELLRLKNCLFVFFFLLLLSGCGESGDPTPEKDPLDRTPMLTHWADNLIIPGYNSFKVKLDVFNSSSAAFRSSPTPSTLQAFRQAWVDAYIEWQKVELFEVGPGNKYAIRNFFNIYPADVAGIKQNFSNPAADLTVPASYAQQGFPAFDYLINGIADTDEAIVALYTTDADAPKRIAYLTKLTDRMTMLLGNVIGEWKGGYREKFIASTGLDIGSSTGEMVNTFVLHYERYIRSGKIGIPSGTMATGAGAKHPEKVEAYYKGDISQTLAITAHQAVVDFFNGKDVTTGVAGASFKSYLDALEAKDQASGTLLSDIINAQFASAASKIGLLNENFFEQITNSNQAMVDTYTEMQKAVRLLKVDMSSAMSVTITYTDNDGD